MGMTLRLPILLEELLKVEFLGMVVGGHELIDAMLLSVGSKAG